MHYWFKQNSTWRRPLSKSALKSHISGTIYGIKSKYCVKIKMAIVNVSKNRNTPFSISDIAVRRIVNQDKYLKNEPRTTLENTQLRPHLILVAYFIILHKKCAKYCDQHGCMSVYLFACLFVLSHKPHVEISPNFLFMIPVAVAQSSSDGSAIRYVLPVLWMEGISSNQRRRYVSSSSPNGGTSRTANNVV